MAEGGLYSQAEQREEEREEEEYKQIKDWSVNERKKNGAKCESCLRGDSAWEERSWRERRESDRRGERPWYDKVAVFMCFVCQIYVCADCMSKHKGHEGMKVGRRESERQEREESERMGEHSEKEGNTGKGKGLGKAAKRVRLEAESKREKMRRKYINRVMNESEIERKEKFYSSHVVVCDRVEVRHELDQTEDCSITGLCGLENKRWVVCDRDNHCIKIYEVGSNVLQRYIRFVGSEPWGVTEIHLKQNSAEPNLVSGSSSDISETGWADPGKQCLIAVTLPRKRQILFIDLNKNPAKTQKTIKTEKQCFDIKFYDDKIFTVCREDPLSVYSRSVYIHSTDGVTLHKFNADNYDVFLAVVSGRVYLTNLYNSKVQCRNVKGQVDTEITIEGSWPVGISVDPDNNVYVCARKHNKVYKLNADLTRYKSVLDQTAGYLEELSALCYYRDKLFISHDRSSYLRNVVTVVRLL